MENMTMMLLISAVIILILGLVWQRHYFYTQVAQSVAQRTAELEQSLIQYKIKYESSHERLNEKAQYLLQIQQKLQETEAREKELGQHIIELRERIGVLSTKAENLTVQLEEKHNLLSTREKEYAHLSTDFHRIKQEFAQLEMSASEKQANFEQQQRHFLEMRQQLNIEFQHLAQQILNEKSQSFAQTNLTSLDMLLKPFREQIEAFQKRINEVHSESLKGSANLESEIKRILAVGMSMSQEAQNLTSALKGNNKIAGNWGEIQLETALQNAGLLKNEHYLAQQSYYDETGKRFNPDFVVKLPDNKHIVIDSKVSLLAYEQAVSSQDQSAISILLNDHCRSLRQHIDGLAKKDYSALLGIKSPDFVLMFVPVEPAYIEAMKHDTQLFNYGYEQRVILVSYTTLMPILRTIHNLWRIEKGNIKAREISEKAGDIYNQVCVIAERLINLGKTLNSANRHYNDSVIALVGQKGLIGKVEHFQKLSTKANQHIPQIEPLNNEFDTTRLELVIEKLEK